ncbi:hypothetical protein E5358_10925 [Palleniella muris]|uniref:Uncharacterized protein n=1 Tax=Palleniella muris TaxID=3038145 RepID=A0AC61QNV8_9BACT|nr:hypothetical protein [Palleniella muris]TGX81335.1 hypothetical protein E5358_10925 [Palleniella muris]
MMEMIAYAAKRAYSKYHNDLKKNNFMEKEIVSLNKELPQFFLEELEERLETDPLSVGGLYDLEASSDSGDDFCLKDEICNIDGPCKERHHCTLNF